MNFIRIRGLVIRTVDVRESDRMMTVFSEEMGVVSAMARGARSLKSRQFSATMQYCYGQYVLAEKDGHYWVREAELIESFFDIRKTLPGLALAAYICEVLSYVTTAEADRDLLRLSLNSLYAIGSGRYTADTVKASFEIRACSILGFMPDVVACRQCGCRRGDFLLDVMDGSVLCFSCRDTWQAEEAAHAAAVDFRENRVVCLLSEGAKYAMEYCIFCPLEKIFSFRISNEDMRLFSKAAETYLLHHLERTFKTLDFYYQVKS